MDKLHDIVRRYNETIYTVDETDGILDNELLAELDGIEGELEDKVNALLGVADNLYSKSDQLKARANALDRHSRALSNRADRLKDYLLNQLRRADIKRLETRDYPIIRIGKSQSVQVFDLDRLTDWAKTHDHGLVKEFAETRPVKKLIKEAIRRGSEVPGVTLIESEYLTWR